MVLEGNIEDGLPVEKLNVQLVEHAEDEEIQIISSSPKDGVKGPALDPLF